MKPKLILCLALVLSGGLIASADESNAPVSTNAAQSDVTARVKANWMDAKVTLYRAAGGAVQLDAKREVVTVCYEPYTNDWDVLAFVDPETGNAWVGSGIDIGQKFYLETETGIICGTVLFWGPIVLGAPRRDINGVIVGSEVGGRLNWDRSFVPRVKRGENVDAAIEQFNKTIDLKSVGRMPEESFTPLGDNLRRVENGL